MNDFRLSGRVRPKRYELDIELDLERWTSLGRARIELSLADAASEITLHAIDLDVTAASLDDQKMSGLSYDAESQTATLRFPKAVNAGDHVLTLFWTGGILEKLRGLYRSTRGAERYAATQFEAADARRAFPSFDEPEYKARWSVTLTHETALAAIANMPIEKQERMKDGRTRTRFRETPPISSYLVAFTVGPYEATPEAKTRSGIPVRVWLPPGLAERAIYARDAHVRALEWLEAYTAIPYAYTKVDAIAIPDFEAGAMENPGAITYRVTLLQADRQTASTATFKRVFSVAAHELTHMWWGDLVTMAWWNDLWLNESFASFVGDKCTGALNPEWGFERDVVQENTPAFSLDSLVSTHPISMEARNADEASERFDAITYSKGQGVLRMIETFLGEDAFRDGVRIYLGRHREKNATADDFWRALGEAAKRDVMTIANAWIKEPGHPLVSCVVTERPDGLEVSMRQARFFADPAAAPTKQVWPVPMVFRYGTSGGVKEQRVLLEGETGSVLLKGATWHHPNAGGTGFYRTALDDTSVRLLAGAIKSLSPEERLALLDNQWALARANKATLSQVFELVRGLGAEEDRAVLETVLGIFAALDHHGVRATTEPAFRAVLERLFRPHLDKLGWDPREDDTTDERENRASALRALGSVSAASDVRREARARVDHHLADERKLHPEIAGTVVSIAAAEGDFALFERYIDRMERMQTADAQEEARFRTALVDFEDPAISARAAGLIFTEMIRDQDRSLLIGRMLGSRYTREAGWAVLKREWDGWVVRMDPAGKQRCVSAISQLTPRKLADEAVAFLHEKQTPDIKETVAQATERNRIGAANAERWSRELEDALKVAQPARA